MTRFIAGAIALFVVLLPTILSQQHEGPLRQLISGSLLSEDNNFWNRLLQEVGGSMDTGDSDVTSIEGMVIVPSLFSFEDTYDNLITALEKAPVNIVAVFPHSDAAAGVGSMLAVFGNPNLGTPLMQLNRQVGIDLPQKMLVWKNEDGEVFVGYNSVPYLDFRHEGIEDAETPFATVAGALLNFASAASGVPKEEIPVQSDVKLESNGIITEASGTDFETTWDRLVAAIEASPAEIAFTVDHSVNAQSVGLELLPTRLVLFGNPVLGTPLMQVSPTAGIDLPLKFLVWQDENGNVQVTTNNMDFIETRHNIKGIDEALNRVKTAVQNFLAVATVTQGL